MKKILSYLIIMLVCMTGALAWTQIPYYIEDENGVALLSVDVLAFECSTTSCSQLGTEEFDATSNSNYIEVFFPENYGYHTNVPEQDVVVYFFKEGYQPFAETMTLDNDVDGNGFASDYIAAERTAVLEKKDTCTAPIASASVADSEVEVGYDVEFDINVESAFENSLSVFPLGADMSEGVGYYNRFHEFYEAETEITVTINTPDGYSFDSQMSRDITVDTVELVESDFNIPADFVAGEYDVEIRTFVTDDVCQASQEDTESLAFTVLGDPVVWGPAETFQDLGMGDGFYHGEANVDSFLWILAADPDSPTYNMTIEWDVYGDGSTIYTGSDVSFYFVTSNYWGYGINHTYTEEGTFTVLITATDDEGVSTVSTQQIIVGPPNEAPIVTIDPAETSADPVTPADLDASGTTDDSDDLADMWFSWDCDTDGTPEQEDYGLTNVQCDYSTFLYGDYTVTLTVTDTDGASSTGTALVHYVESMNQPPIAEANGPYTAEDGDEIQFDSEGSYDTDGSIVSYEWDFETDGTPDSTDANPTYTYPGVGNYVATLCVEDDLGAITCDTADVEITEYVNDAPIADPDGNYAGVVGQEIQFNSDESYDPDGTIVGYEWDFETDGVVDSTDANPTHTYDATGAYTATLCVEDNEGAIGCDYADVEIYDELVVTLTATPSEGYAPLEVLLEATVTGGVPAIHYSWDIDGDGVVDAEAGDGDTTSFIIEFPTDPYTATVYVDDWRGNTAEASVELSAELDPEVAHIDIEIDAPGGDLDETDWSSADAGDYCAVTGEPDLQVLFDARGSSSYGDIVSYSWDFNGDGVEDSSDSVESYWFREDGTYAVTLTIVDEYGVEVTATVYICVADELDNDPRRTVYIGGIAFLDDEIEVMAGDWLPLHVTVENIGDMDIENLKISATIQELGVYATSTEFEFDRNDQEARTLHIEIPEWTQPGWYDVRITISDDYVHRYRHRDILVIG